MRLLPLKIHKTVRLQCLRYKLITTRKNVEMRDSNDDDPLEEQPTHYSNTVWINLMCAHIMYMYKLQLKSRMQLSTICLLIGNYSQSLHVSVGLLCFQL